MGVERGAVFIFDYNQNIKYVATGVGLKICKSGLLRWVCTYETAIDTRAVYLKKQKHYCYQTSLQEGVHIFWGTCQS